MSLLPSAVCYGDTWVLAADCSCVCWGRSAGRLSLRSVVIAREATLQVSLTPRRQSDHKPTRQSGVLKEAARFRKGVERLSNPIGPHQDPVANVSVLLEEAQSLLVFS